MSAPPARKIHYHVPPFIRVYAQRNAEAAGYVDPDHFKRVVTRLCKASSEDAQAVLNYENVPLTNPKQVDIFALALHLDELGTYALQEYAKTDRSTYCLQMPKAVAFDSTKRFSPNELEHLRHCLPDFTKEEGKVTAAPASMSAVSKSFPVNTVANALQSYMKDRIGAGKTFANERIFFTVMKHIAQSLEIPYFALSRGDLNHLTAAQAKLMAMVLRPSSEQFSELCLMATHEARDGGRPDEAHVITAMRKLKEDDVRDLAKKFLPRAIQENPDFAAARLEFKPKLEAAYPAAQKALEKARDAYAAMKKYNREEANTIAREFFYNLVDAFNADKISRGLAPAIEDLTGIQRRTVHDWLTHRHRPQRGNDIDTIMLHAEPIAQAFFPNRAMHEEVMHYLSAVPWAAKKSGNGLLTFGHQHDMDGMELLRLARHQERLSYADFSGWLGIKHSDLNHMKAGHEVAGTKIIDKVSKKLGCVSDEELIGFRHFIQGTKTPVTQEQLAQFFTEDHNGMSPFEKRQAFGNLLLQRRGLRNYKELAMELAQNGEPLESVHYRFREHFTGHDNSQWRDSKTMDIESAEPIASFAFPNDPVSHQHCIDLLTTTPEKLSPDRMHTARVVQKAARAAARKR